MLRTDATKLRWMGVDMRPRWRRRVAVILTYAVFLIAVWVHPRRTLVVLQVLLYAQMMSGLWELLEEAFSVWARRAVACVLLLLAAYLVIASRPNRPQSYTDITLYAVFLVVGASVVGWSRLVEPSGAGWLARSVAAGEAQSWRKQRRLARLGFAVGLDGFAWYEYGMRFKKLTAEQQLEIEELRHSNPRGKWMRERLTVLFDDERLRQEDDRMKARVQRVMSVVLIVLATLCSSVLVIDRSIRPETVIAGAWTLAVLSVTLRQAIVLWSEEDPIATSGEMELVEREA
jgi:hypothetical protein